MRMPVMHFRMEHGDRRRRTMEWSDLRIFLAIAREGSLGAAARKLGQTQPTMGRRLKALEDAVGQKLFQRTTAGFLLTGDGAAVLGHAERVESEALSFERRLAGADRQLDGQLRITASDWFGEHVLTSVVADFAVAHPRVLVELLTDARLLSLSRREADIAFRIRPFDEPDVVSRKLVRTRYDLYAKAGTRPPLAGDGEGSALITMDAALGDMPDVAWLRRVLPNAQIVFRSNARAIHARMCARGVGLAVLPRLLGDATPGLVRIDLGDDPPTRDTWVGYHRDLRRLARLRALIEMVVAKLGR
jgi:DNA-binding transcriptional LysR family regulator